jgi:hypothetical protein
MIEHSDISRLYQRVYKIEKDMKKLRQKILDMNAKYKEKKEVKE